MVNGSSLVIPLAASSGDATGATDTTTIQAALATAAAAAAASGAQHAIVRAQHGQVYKIACNSTQSIVQAGGNTSTAQPYALAIPSNVILDLNGSTLQVAAGSLGAAVTNATRNATYGTYSDHDVGLINAVIDRQNNADTARAAVEIAQVTRPTLTNVKVINSQFIGVYTYGNQQANYDQCIADTIAGQGFSLGNAAAGMQEDHATIGTLIARNCTAASANPFNEPGNGIYLVAYDSKVDALYQYNCAGGIKIQSTDTVISQWFMDGGSNATSNSGFKMQNSGLGVCLRVHVGEGHSINQPFFGLYFEGCTDCTVNDYYGYNNGLLGTSGYDIWIGGTRDHVWNAHIDSPLTYGINVRAYANDYHLGHVKIRNPNQMYAYAPATTVAAASNGLTNPQTTVFVAAIPAGTPMNGQFTVAGDTITYTGIQSSPPAFTGCTGGTHAMATGNAVVVVVSTAIYGVFVTGGSSAGQIDSLEVIDEMAAPVGINVVANAGGGSFSAGTYYWVVTFTNANGETVASYQAAVAVAASGTATLTWLASTDPSWTGTNIYRSTTSTFTSPALVASIGKVATYTDTGTAVSTGVPPAYNTATRKAIGYALYVGAGATCIIPNLKTYGYLTSPTNLASTNVALANVVPGPPYTCSVVSSSLPTPSVGASYGKIIKSGFYNGADCTSLAATVQPSQGIPFAMLIVLANTVVVSAMGANVGTVGDSASTVALCIWADSGGRPGNLLLSAGSIAGITLGYQEITGLSTTLVPGRYWLGGICQNVTTTAPKLYGTTGIQLPMLDGSTGSTATTGTFGGYTGTSQGNGTPGNFAGAAQAGPTVRVVIKAT